MFTLVSAVILYTAGFLFLYGVVRLAVRHAILDVERMRPDVPESDERTALQERTFVKENAFLAGG